jgi:site-specific DNA-methyltransferase (adenine-specific)
MNPTWQSGGVSLYLGDCLDILPTLEAGSVDAVVTDPPYGTTACKWDVVIPFAPMWAELRRIAKQGAAVVLFGSQPFTSLLVTSNLDWFKYELIWDKNFGGAPGLAKYRPMPSHESMMVFGTGRTTYNPQMQVGKPYTDIRSGDRAKKNGNEHGLGYKNNFTIINDGERYPLSVIRVQRYNVEGQHPTEKPTLLLDYLIRTYTNEGETVLDFTIGSGTTGVACVQTGRKFIGIEIDPTYFEIAKRRIIDAQAQMRMDL